MKSSRVLYIVLSVQTVLLAYLILAPAQPIAMAQGVPDMGAQLQQVIDQTKSINTKLDQISGQLQTGVKVKVVQDKQ